MKRAYYIDMKVKKRHKKKPNCFSNLINTKCIIYSNSSSRLSSISTSSKISLTGKSKSLT